MLVLRQLMTLLDARKSVNCHMVRHFLSQSLFGCLGNKTERVQHELEAINQTARERWVGEGGCDVMYSEDSVYECEEMGYYI